jgi:hypothetical protein
LNGARSPLPPRSRYSVASTGWLPPLTVRSPPRTGSPHAYEGCSHFAEGRAGIERELAGAPPDVRAALRRLPLGEAVDVV